jgi:predicted short-subunit dehydrogenase-like oxidoreductase (DUF2520 family)
VGAGRVGTTLASLLGRAGRAPASVVDRSLGAARRGARRAGAGLATTSLRKGTRGADLLLLAVPDRALESLTAALVPLGPWPGRVVLHTCGAEGPSALDPLAEAGAETGALHPLQTFPSPLRPLESLRGVRAAVAGSPAAERAARGLCRALGLVPLTIREEGRALYHLGAVLASNHVVSLLDAAVEALEAAGLPREEALASLLPLLAGAHSALGERGLPGALTGPVARGDTGTLDRHLDALEALDPDVGRLYRELSRRALRLALEAGTVSETEARRMQRRLGGKARRR